MPVALLLLGGALAAYSLWQLRRWLVEAERHAAAGPRRLEAIAAELIATAEGTAAAVAEKTEALADAIARANAAAARLDAAAVGAGDPEGPQAPSPEPAPVKAAPAPVVERPEMHRRVYSLADAGLDVTGIARQLGLAKGEVQLILGLRTMN